MRISAHFCAPPVHLRPRCCFPSTYTHLNFSADSQLFYSFFLIFSDYFCFARGERKINYKWSSFDEALCKWNVCQHAGVCPWVCVCVCVQCGALIALCLFRCFSDFVELAESWVKVAPYIMSGYKFC